MIKKLLTTLSFCFFGCASTQPSSPPPTLNVPSTEVPEPKEELIIKPKPVMHEVSGDGWSFQVPNSFVKLEDKYLTSAYQSLSGDFVIAFLTEPTNETLEIYSEKFVKEMQNGRIKFVASRQGKINGKDTVVSLFTMNSIISYHAIFVENGKAYNMNCAFSFIMLKSYAPLCAEITRSLRF